MQQPQGNTISFGGNTYLVTPAGKWYLRVASLTYNGNVGSWQPIPNVRVPLELKKQANEQNNT